MLPLKKMGEIDVRLGLKAILKRINEASERRIAELKYSKPQLVAVSKTKPVEMIIDCYEAGQRHFGENYANELIEKATNKDIVETCKEIKWHYIGHLQTNKINKLLQAPNIYMIETIDSLKLAANVQKAWWKFTDGVKLKVMVQVNTSAEDAKNGVDPSDAIDLARFIRNECPDLKLNGLMTIGRFDYDPSEGANPDFLLLRKCRQDVAEALELDPKSLQLSMGMSNDFEHAIELGSTNVRVGSSIFGYREPKKPSDSGNN